MLTYSRFSFSLTREKCAKSTSCSVNCYKMATPFTAWHSFTKGSTTKFQGPSLYGFLQGLILSFAYCLCRDMHVGFLWVLCFPRSHPNTPNPNPRFIGQTVPSCEWVYASWVFIVCSLSRIEQLLKICEWINECYLQSHKDDMDNNSYKFLQQMQQSRERRDFCQIGDLIHPTWCD